MPLTAAASDLASVDPRTLGPFGHPCLVVPLNAAQAPTWLRHAPCPVLGVGDPGHPVAPHCDTTVAFMADLAPLLDNIARAPIAATTLVHLLRAAESLKLHDALVLESLAYATLQDGAEHRAWLATRPAAAAAPAEPGPPILAERCGPHLALQLNRPASRNEIDTTMRDALTELFDLAALDCEITRVSLRGAGRAFCIGGALREFGTAPDPATAHAIRLARGPAFALARIAEKLHAQVHGACIGAGAELASLCARVSAPACTFFQLPELRMGLIPGCGGTAGLMRRIGRHRTAWLALSGRRLPARQALAWGLIDDITRGVKEGGGVSPPSTP